MRPQPIQRQRTQRSPQGRLQHLLQTDQHIVLKIGIKPSPPQLCGDQIEPLAGLRGLSRREGELFKDPVQTVPGPGPAREGRQRPRLRPCRFCPGQDRFLGAGIAIATLLMELNVVG